MFATPSDAIGLLGGAAPVSRRLGRAYTTVKSWTDRQSIPVDAWPQLIEFAQEKELPEFTYEALVRAHQPRNTASQPEQTDA